jgi:predicted HicB family RNase H-like nuclease
MRAWSYKNYKALVAFDPDDEIFIGRIVGINDVVGFHATTVKALKTAFHEAVDDYLATCAKLGKQPEREMSGNLMLRIAPEVHADAAIAAELAGKSLNQWAEDVLRRAVGEKVSEARQPRGRSGAPVRASGASLESAPRARRGSSSAR